MIPNTKPKDSPAVRIDRSRYLDYTGLGRVTATVLAMFRADFKQSFRNAARVLKPAEVAKPTYNRIICRGMVMNFDTLISARQIANKPG